MSTITTPFGVVEIEGGQWAAPEPLLTLLETARTSGAYGPYPWPGAGVVDPTDPWAVAGWLGEFFWPSPVDPVDMPDITVGDVIVDTEPVDEPELVAHADHNQKTHGRRPALVAHLPGKHDQKTHGGGGGGVGADMAGVLPDRWEPVGKRDWRIEPGQRPVPEGMVRLYHYTGSMAALESIERTGLRTDHAKGDTYGEPNQVWASAEMPDPHTHAFVEFYADPKTELDVGRYSTPEELESHGSNVTMLGDVSPDRIIGVHAPWMATARYVLGEGTDEAYLRTYGFIDDQNRFHSPDIDEHTDAGVAAAVALLRSEGKLSMPDDGLVAHLPGQHDQRTHGRGGGILDVTRGEATRKRQKVSTHLTGPDGEPILLSVADLGRTASKLPGEPLKDSEAEQAAALDANVRDGVAAKTGGAAGHQVDDIEANVARVLDSAARRYADHPELVAQDRFYEQWNTITGRLAEESGFGQAEVVAAAACISPGSKAHQNLRYATDLVRMVQENPPIAADADLGRVAADMRTLAEDKRLTAMAASKDGKSVSPAKQREIDDYLEAAALIESGAATRVLDLPGIAAARVLQGHRQANGPKGTMPIDGIDGLPVEYAAVSESTKAAGFGVSKGYKNYGNAINVLRGYELRGGERTPYTPDDALRGVKVRSFSNNILDPLDAGGHRSVTIDFHTENAAFGIVGANHDTYWDQGVKVAGVGIGVRAHVADAIRAAKPALSAQLGEDLSDARVQEILWAEWQRGLDSTALRTTKAGTGTGTLAWTPYGEAEAAPLLDLRKRDEDDEEEAADE